jgi:hypothetical protein
VNLPRFRSEAPQIFVAGEMGVISGGQVGEARPAGSYGDIMLAGRPADAANLAAARKFFLEAKGSDFELRGELFLDRGSGVLYERVLFDPLSAAVPSETGIACFIEWGGRVAFLRRSTTLAAVEQGEAQALARAERAAEAEAKFRSRQPQVAVSLADVFGEQFALTVRAAAGRVLELSGEIRLDERDQVVVTLPAVLDASDGVTHGLAEMELRRSVHTACEVLSRASVVVAAAIREQTGSKKSLLELLPDVEVGVAGGLS